jgi:hypothetical protein
MGAEYYLWTLQIQNFLGYEVDGSQTSIENPSCYLYNAGINKIRLTAINMDGCVNSVLANNIYVNDMNLAQERKSSAFASEDGEYPINISESIINVYPTILSKQQETINVYSNEAEVEYGIYTTNGTLILSGKNAYSFQIILPHMMEGMYVLKLNGKYIKLIKL